MKPYGSPVILLALVVSLTLLTALSGCVSVNTARPPRFGRVTVFQNDLRGFNAAAGASPIVIDFDSVPAGTNISGNTINGVTFISPDGNSLDVVIGNDTFTPAGFSGVIDANTNKLFPTSGANVLSPGGLCLVPGPALAQRDSLQLTFTPRLKAFGLDILFQSKDYASYTDFFVYDSANILLGSGNVNSGTGRAGSPGGSVFLGFVSDSANIAKIIIRESDDDAVNPDSNIGYDTFRLYY